MTEDEVVAQLADGMTIGIGGWGSRRKPMSLVRAILRSDLKELTIVTYGGPEVGLLCRAGKVRKLVYGFVSLDSIPLEPHFRIARQSGAVEVMELDEGAFYLGLMAAAHRVPFYPTRAGLGSDMLMMNPSIRTIRSPYPGPDGSEGEELVAIPAFELDVSLIHMNRADQAGNGQFLGPDLYFDDLFAQAAPVTFMSAEKIIATEAFADEGSIHTQRIPRIFVTGVVEAPDGGPFHRVSPGLRPRRGVPTGVRGDRQGRRGMGHFHRRVARPSEPRRLRREARGPTDRHRRRRPRGGPLMPTEATPTETTPAQTSPAEATLAEICVVNLADTFRADGEILCNPIGPVPIVAGRLARATFAPQLAYTDTIASLPAGNYPIGVPDAPKVVESWVPYRTIFDIVWSGRRHVVMGATQVDRYGNQNIAAIGDWRQPSAQLLGLRGAPGNLINHTTSFWIPNHSTKAFVARVDVVSGPGYDRMRELGAPGNRFHEIRRVVSNLGVFDFETPDNAMRLRSVHPGVSVADVVAATGFELVIPADVPESRRPTAEELQLIREVIDPNGVRNSEFR